MPQDCCAIPKSLLKDSEYSWVIYDFEPPPLTDEVTEWFGEMQYQFKTRWFWKPFDDGNDAYQKYRIKNNNGFIRQCVPILFFGKNAASAIVMFRMRWIS